MTRSHQRAGLLAWHTLIGCGCSAVASTSVLAAPFQQRLTLQGVSFQLNATGDGSSQQLVVKASEHGKAYPVVREQADGTVSGAEVEDLNSDGRPYLFVYVSSAGSGSYGTVMAWSASKGHTLVRMFPLYRPGDSNASPSGGTRQINDKLVAGEASWQLKPMSSTDFP